MNYCCEAYVVLYRDPCLYCKNRKQTCPQVDPSNLKLRYRDLLCEPAEGNLLTLKPKADTCPFCNMSLLNTGRYPRDMTGLEYATLKDVPEGRADRAERHIYQTPDPEVGAALGRWLTTESTITVDSVESKSTLTVDSA